MKKLLDRFYFQKREQLQVWSQKKVFNLFIFNIILVLLLLLRSAGYFSPFFTITINLIILLSLILFVILLNATSRIVFLIALLLWLFAAFMKIVGVDVWAERTAVYAFEALVVGVGLLIFRR